MLAKVSLLLGRSFDQKALSKVTLRGQVEPVVNEIVYLARIMGLEVGNNGIVELIEEHSQDLTTEDLKEFHCDSQQAVVGESLSEKEKVTEKRQSSGAIREMLKTWKTGASSLRSFTLIRQWLCAKQIHLITN
ncbi:hypothetical protein AVEN_175132-1 [Araneus ventricosus]|uniref:Uncharacterized protein n=1 Tax=Araneus ventricosus TaxID=182803 RepID=A0A4Y2X6Z2_ARAVE|nr:hypothetical protein AVEN_175132-1 [Araneus ventricosus]